VAAVFVALVVVVVVAVAVVWYPKGGILVWTFGVREGVAPVWVPKEAFGASGSPSAIWIVCPYRETMIAGVCGTSCWNCVEVAPVCCFGCRSVSHFENLEFPRRH